MARSASSYRTFRRNAHRARFAGTPCGAFHFYWTLHSNARLVPALPSSNKFLGPYTPVVGITQEQARRRRQQLSQQTEN